MLSKLKEFIGVGIVFGVTGSIFLANLAIDSYLYKDNKIDRMLRK